MPIMSKLPNTGTTIFSVMSGLAAEHGAINLSQGFPDFPLDETLTDLVSHYMKKGFNQYAPATGLPVLREAISDKAEKLYGFRYNPETEVTVTSGATEALFDALTAIVQEGDEVIIFEPAYDSYTPAIELNGGKAVPVTLEPPHYRVPWDEVRKKVSPKTRAIMTNTPHNPTGTNWEEEDLDALHDLVKGTDIFVISDEVYEHIVFDEEKHRSVMAHAGLRERSFVVFSFGKTVHATGWKLGYCMAPAELSREFRKIHQFVTFSSPTPMQAALADYIADGKNYLSIPDFYAEKRDTFCKLLEGSRWKIKPSAGTYFQLADYSAVSDEPDTEFAKRLTREHGVASIPISVFYHNGLDRKMLRFCFAKNTKTLEAAAEILRTL